MKSLIPFFTLLFFVNGFSQTNLIDASTWSAGNGNVPGFFKHGTDAKNLRETDVDPFGQSNIVWKGLADGSTIQDGGFNTQYYVVDPSKDFRFTVWIKKINSNDGNTLFGFHALNTSETATSQQLDGTPQASPYFYWGDLPQLDEWYLLVGYAYGHGHTDLNHQGGIYDTSGVKVATLTDFKLSTTSHWLVHRAYLYNDPNASDQQFFYGPTLYEINGQEPTIQELINSGSSGSTLWAENNGNIHFDSGNVGIGISDPGTDKLAVNGNIRAKEVKVEITNWPDYVFEKDYKLPTLYEVEQHIKKKGHLINIPSASEINIGGVDLGEMNKLLLEKIEELTLYIIQQEKRIQKLESKK
ncbi:hypothetical protein PP182_19850 [Maribacter sp. PR1]|uniref:Peptidase S74 domain-containing protein n=1 Tax=Maribacter cobaltidurans TaxID=1178778 RepID=A0ABU7IZB9_9FLAO|nr:MULTISPECIES: hypothetical protein [Maribacter]MDC6390950.1 hypothetical protein [Maribacter sp. PR1]MEE1978342.1 hypothetical protein [Maribacter cobaltidurans]